MTGRHTFPCGCSWPVVGEPLLPGTLPLMDVDLENLPFCDATWDLLASGRTKGVFQLETPLGRQWAKRLKPRSPEHLSALGAILRPGCLKSKDADGVSMTEHYCRRANNEEQPAPLHHTLSAILESTYGTMPYQEQLK
jgi:DNA polymerase-3 subunit alpha